jgi:hypothetical protein
MKKTLAVMIAMFLLAGQGCNCRPEKSNFKNVYVLEILSQKGDREPIAILMDVHVYEGIYIILGDDVYIVKYVGLYPFVERKNGYYVQNIKKSKNVYRVGVRFVGKTEDSPEGIEKHSNNWVEYAEELVQQK